MNDRERLIDILYKGFYISPGNDIKGTVQKAADYLISHGVTVQKHGRWSYDEEASKWGFPFLCSACHKAHDHKEPFCPNCGAKMDGEA